MSTLIDVRNIYKYYGNQAIIKEVSFTLDKGDVLGFLGPNGAGKTTTMKILTGYINADSGEVFIDQKDIQQEPLAIKKNMGYVPEGSPLYEDMRVVDFLHFCAKARQIAPFDIKLCVKRAVDRLHLHEVVMKKIEELSKGFKRRVGIAQAILHDPQVLILDEPTDGLDPNQKQEIRNLIKEIQQDKAIIISTHILDEAQALCNKVIILNEGAIIVNDSLQGLMQQYTGKSLEAIFQQLTFKPTAFKEVAV